MIGRRSFVQALGALFALGMLPRAHAQYAATVTVYMSPACGCCDDWQKHMRASGFRLETHKLGDVVPMKQRLGVPESLWSCHTSTVGGYWFEGHVPSSDIKRLLRERAKVKGLAVPGMVVGSPGMEQGPAKPYATLAFDGSGSRVYERH
jgi:hypothetical protein